MIGFVMEKQQLIVTTNLLILLKMYLHPNLFLEYRVLYKNCLSSALE